jgi:hypothetical protein
MHDCDAYIGVRLLACFLPPNCKFDKPSLFNCLDADFFFFFFYFLLMFTFGGVSVWFIRRYGLAMSNMI